MEDLKREPHALLTDVNLMMVGKVVHVDSNNDQWSDYTGNKGRLENGGEHLPTTLLTHGPQEMAQYWG